MRKIIVIEDDENVRSNLIELLDAEGYLTFEAKNGEEAYRIILEKLPDLIICDILMPILDGYGLLLRCSQEPQTAMIPFIFLTALTERDNLRKGMEMGADDFITKPFTRVEILHAIETRIEKRVLVEKFAQEKLLNLESELEWAIPYEILEPISTLLGYSDYITQYHDTLKPGDFLRVGSDMQWTLSKLVDLIQNYVLFSELGNSLLDGTKIAEMRNSRVYNVNQLIAEIVSSKLKVERREEDLVFRFDDGDIKIDEFHLAKMIELILDNIILRSDKSQTFEIEGISDLEKQKYRIQIIDHGRSLREDQIGILNESIVTNSLLRPDYRHNKPDIGLMVLKRILTVFNGSISVFADELAKTRLQIELPMPK